MISTIVVRFQQFLVLILLSKYAIESWFNIPPRLFIVRILPWETLRPWNQFKYSKYRLVNCDSVTGYGMQYDLRKFGFTNRVV